MRRKRMRGITPFQFSVRVGLCVVAAMLAPAVLLVAGPVIFYFIPIAVLVLPFLLPAFMPEATHGKPAEAHKPPLHTRAAH